MALDINEARKGSGELDTFLGLAKELTDFGERQSFLRMKDMPFDKALMEFVTSCKRWYGLPYKEIQETLNVMSAEGSLEIMSHVIYTCVLNVLLGMPILLFKEIYINYCLYKYIHSEGEEAKEYYKMRAEQGFGCTLEEEVIRRAMEDPIGEMDNIYPEEPSAAETLYEDTKWWGLNPESQYSFVKYWKTSSNMPKDLIKVTATFVAALRDYIDIDIDAICPKGVDNLMQAAYSLTTKYKIFNEAGIESIHKSTMIACGFRCCLDKQRKQEVCYQQNQMREESHLL